MTAASTLPGSLPRVALYGTFDVLNFGDLLFPHLVRHALGPHLHECVAVSPTRTTLPWADTVPTCAVEDAPGLGAGLHMIGGGNIINAQETPLAAYGAARFGRQGAYASLWLGAALIAAESGARLAWNAPGVPAVLVGSRLGRLRDAVLNASDYIGLRDAASAGFLGAPTSMQPAILPDTAIDIARVWPAATLREHARRGFARQGVAMPEAWTVFHLNERYLDGDEATQADAIAQIAAATGTMPVLVAIGPCHGDDALARRIGARIRPGALVVDEPAGLKEIAALIAHSTGYVGSSLHGLITALSYARPAITIARPHMVKFSGFLDQLGMGDRLFASWQGARKAAYRMLRPLTESEIAAIGRAQDQVGEHWRRMRPLVLGGAVQRAVAGRARLRAWMEGRENGPRDWRAFTTVLEEAPPPASLTAAVTTPCNICGKTEFRPGAISLSEELAGDAVCRGCGATAQHRAMRTVFDVLRRPGAKGQTCLRLGKNRVVAAGWFARSREVEIDPRIGPVLEPEESAGMVVCISMLEQAPDVAEALRSLFRATARGGFLFVALRDVPGRERTLDWGFPRSDRDGEFRRFGADFETGLAAMLPESHIVVAEPVDPVTGKSTRAFLCAHAPDDLGALLESDVAARRLRPGSVPA